MVRDVPLTAIIPVRGGSKGIPGKNLYEFMGETLLERTIGFSKTCSRIDDVYVTTDDHEMQRIARSSGAQAPFLRPARLAGDGTLTIDAVKHLLQKVGINKGYVVLLQVTSPLRECHDLEEICSNFEATPEAQSVVSVVRHVEPHPEKMLQIKNGHLESYISGNQSAPRQMLPEVYALNGAFYVSSVERILKQDSIWGHRTLPYTMPPERSVNLDSDLDIVLLEALAAWGRVKPERYNTPTRTGDGHEHF